MKSLRAWAKAGLTGLLIATGSIAFAASYRYETLYSFDPANGGPTQPRGNLLLGLDGAFYGVTYKGGQLGLGTIFKITSQGDLTVLHEFDGEDGAYPTGLTLGNDGNFYGTTNNSRNGFGAIFRLEANGGFSMLHNFITRGQGIFPASPPVQARDGNLYGVTDSGGTRNCGVVYRLKLPELNYVVQARFGLEGKGCNPYASMVEGKNGALYGITRTGGEGRMGTIFRFTPLFRQLTVLHAFTGSDGVGSRSPLLAGRDGNFYGTSVAGGSQNSGVAYRVTPRGEYTVLHEYGAGAEGGGP